MEGFKLNDRVLVIGKNTKGNIAYIGKTHFAKGKMFGVILDEPKGKYSGTINSVCYFKCKTNHATFVRACQLEKDTNCSSEDWITPAYPNYLNDSSCKQRLKVIRKQVSKSQINIASTTRKNPVKSQKVYQPESLQSENCQKGVEMDEVGEINIVSTTRKKTVKSPKLDHLGNLQYDSYHKSNAIMNEVGEIPKIFNENFGVKLQSLGEALTELSVLKEKLIERNKKMNTVHSYLRKLKTYLKWSKEIKKSSNNGDHRLENFIKLLVDNVLKKMEEVVSQMSSKQVEHFTGEGSAFSEENQLLLQYVENLEKRNDVLADSLAHVWNILERAWNQSRSKKKCKCAGNTKKSNGKVEIGCKDCPSKQLSFTDVLEHETRLFLESNPNKNMKAPEQSHKELEGFSGSEKIKKYLESLLSTKDVTSPTGSDFNSNMKNEDDNFNADQLQTPTPDDAGIQGLSHSTTEPNVSLKYKSFSNNQNGLARNKVRSASRKRPTKQNPEKHQLKNVTDSTMKNVKESAVTNAKGSAKELQQFISEIMARVSDINKSMENCATGVSSSPVPPREAVQEQKTLAEDRSIPMAGCASETNLVMRKKLLSLFPSEKIVKRPRSESAGRANKREIFK